MPCGSRWGPRGARTCRFTRSADSSRSGDRRAEDSRAVLEHRPRGVLDVALEVVAREVCLEGVFVSVALVEEEDVALLGRSVRGVGDASWLGASQLRHRAERPLDGLFSSGLCAIYGDDGVGHAARKPTSAVQPTSTDPNG